MYYTCSFLVRDEEQVSDIYFSAGVSKDRDEPKSKKDAPSSKKDSSAKKSGTSKMYASSGAAGGGGGSSGAAGGAGKAASSSSASVPAGGLHFTSLTWKKTS